MNGKILVFQIPEGETLAKIRLVAMMQSLELRQVGPGEYGRTIGQIAMLPPISGAEGQLLAEPMMVLCMSPERLEGLLTALRTAGVPPICKAVLTATNAGWTPAQLLAELRREREEFQKMKKQGGR